jgi:flagellar biogenesis protein FliO
MSVTVVEGLALGGAESVVDVAVLNQQIVVGANNFHGLLASSSLYHVLGVPVIHA